MIGKNISHYKILEKLGEGGMGVVYKAYDTNLDRIVALKFLPSDSTPGFEDKKRFLQEARAAAQLSHPNICGIYSIGEHEGRQFIEMEYIEGETLRKKMRASGRFDLDTFRDYAIQIAGALTAAHRKNIIHRDIKPENIMIDSDGRVKVMDFGLAKLKGVQHFTKTGSTVGTISYMSPEQLQSAEIDARSDLFSFGIILYEMLTGTHPFKGEYEQAVMFKILNEDPRPPSDLHDDIVLDLEDIVVRCLQKDRDSRYRSADDIRLELEGQEKFPIRQTFKSISKTNWSRLISGSKKLSRKSLVWMVSMSVLMVILGFLWFFPTTPGEKWQESIPDDKHLVVLPFNNLSPQDIPESINDGILEILTSKITQMEMHEGSLWVVPSSEVRASNITSVKEAAKQFGTNLAVTGSLQHVGNRLLLTINLVDGNTMRQLRSSVIEMDWSDHTRLQDEVVHNLTDMLEIELEPSTMQTFTVAGTQSSGVYQLYIEGRGYLSRFEKTENIDKAIHKFREAIESDSGYVRAYAALAEAYWRKFELTRDTRWAENALKYGQDAINTMEDTIPEPFITMALIYNGMGRYEEALEMLDKLNDPERMSYQALIEQATANEGLGKSDKAEELYQQAIKIKNKYWAGYNNLGVFYYKQGRLKEAAEAFRKVTEVAPNNIRGFNNLGGVYFGMGMNEEALGAFDKSLAIQPNFTAFTNLGTFYYYEKNYSEAIRMYERALDLRQTDFRSWGPLGYAYYWSGKDSSKVREYMEMAIELAEKELEIRPNDPEVLTQLAGYHVVIGNKEKCRELLRQLPSLAKMDDDTRVSVIHLYEQLGNRDAALQWAEKSLISGYSLEKLESLEGVEDLLEDPHMKKLQEKYEQQSLNPN